LFLGVFTPSYLNKRDEFVIEKRNDVYNIPYDARARVYRFNYKNFFTLNLSNNTHTYIYIYIYI